MKNINFSRLIFSLLAGIFLSALLTLSYWETPAYSALDRAALVFIPAAAFALLTYAVLPALRRFISSGALSRLRDFRVWLGWGLGAAGGFFLAAILRNFYPASFFLPLAFLSTLACGAFAFYASSRAGRMWQRSPGDSLATLILFGLILAAQVLFFRSAALHPLLFDPYFFLLRPAEFFSFGAAALAALPTLAWLAARLRGVSARLPKFIRAHFWGLTFAAGFFLLYFLIGSVLNHPLLDTDDIFFDSDGFIWRFRLTTDQWQDFYWRSVHPLALLMLRPLVGLLSISLRGNLHFAAIALNALAGAACVFLAWLFLKRALGDSTSAFLTSALLGFSATHLFYGSLIETYIFLALLSLSAFLLAQHGRLSLPLWVAVGVATMGVTLTNVAQTGIALLSLKPRMGFIVRFGLWVVSSTITFTLVSNLFYPAASPYFFVPSTFLAEQQNLREPSANRAQALARAFAFNNVVAPEPLMRQKDIPFKQFRFYRAEDGKMAEYNTPLSAWTVRLWLGLLALAGFSFVWNFKTHPWHLVLPLSGVLLFNLILHLRYGKELFLYSANWTYALLLLVAIVWRRPLRRGWARAALLLFLGVLVFNNMTLFDTIVQITEPYLR